MLDYFNLKSDRNVTSLGLPHTLSNKQAMRINQKSARVQGDSHFTTSSSSYEGNV